jgi:hydrogenase maturation protein HypF
VSLADGGGTAVSTDGAVDAVAAAAAALRSGAIVAIKGLGGFHLACRADDSSVVARLRRAKQRDAKPFALMARDLDAAKALVVLDADERALLTGSARPILLGRRRDDAVIAAEVAPARRELGVMLPYTPLHHLLMADITAPLVMTSGNRSDEPIACRNDDALRRLSPIADLFLLHDRDIAARCEDSVVRVVAMRDRRDTLMIRRARGYVPEPIGIPVPTADTILATGGQLKNTVSLARGDRVVVGPHTGDLADAATFAAFARGVEHLERLTGAAPAVVAHDLHPDYPSTTYALAREERRRVGVQHHHAHLAACLAEYGETEPAVGVIFDGSGFGSDGLVWGGEFLFGDLGTFERLGHLRAVAMPGGERAVREPWRMACAWLADAHGEVPPIPEPLRQVVDDTRWRSVAKLAASRMHSPLTTSVGRLLDACAAITGLCPFISYEGQAAIEFEADARTLDPSSAYPITIDAAGDEFVVDPREMILSVAGDAERGVPRTQISSRMHSGLVYAARTGARLAAARTGARTVVLSGGVFQNVLMLEALVRALMEDGMRVLVPRRLPPNDGGLSFGQAAVAAWRRRQDVSGDTRTGA